MSKEVKLLPKQFKHCYSYHDIGHNGITRSCGKDSGSWNYIHYLLLRAQDTGERTGTYIPLLTMESAYLIWKAFYNVW